MFDVTTEFNEQLIEITKNNVRVAETRSKRSSKGVLDYETGTQFKLNGTSYFHDILSRRNKQISCDEAGNFILNTILPIPLVGSATESSRCRFGQRKFIKLFGKQSPAVEEVLAGSLSEGLRLPQIFHIKANTSKIKIPDEDKKYIFHGLNVSENNRKSIAILEPTLDSPKAFVKLKLNIVPHYLKDFEFKSTLNKGYIIRDKFIAKLKDKLKGHVVSLNHDKPIIKCRGEHKSEISFSKHGPATTADVSDEINTLFSTDHVICLPCPVWPNQAKRWSKRKRIWPTKSLVQKIVREGCHIVGKGEMDSKDEKEQFCFSFSLCDKTLSKAMTLNQKRCYMLFKYIFKYCFDKPQRGLASFFCKTTYLWVCESTPESEWREESVLDCIIVLVKRFKGYLKQGHLPHYYIPEFNLIGKMTQASKSACIADINLFLQSPWQTVLRLTESFRFCWLSKDISMKEIFRELTDGIRQTREVSVASCLLNFFSELLDKGEVVHVLSIVCKQWLSSSNVKLDIRLCISHLEDMISMLDGHGNLVCLNGLLGNLYHQLSCETDNLKPLWKSLDILLMAQKTAGRHTWIYACLYDLLIYTQDFDKVIRHFHCYVRNDFLYAEGMYTVLSNYNFDTAFNFTDLFGETVIPSTAYILYQVIMAYIGLMQSSRSLYKRWLFRKEALKVLKHLHKWTNRKCSLYPELYDDQLNYIAGFAAEIVGDKEIALKSYQETLSIGNTLLGVNLDELGKVNVVPEYMMERPNGSFDSKSLRFQPYQKSKREQSVGLTKGWVFEEGRPRVGRYMHN